MTDQQQQAAPPQPQQAAPPPPAAAGERPGEGPWAAVGSVLVMAAVLACAVILADVAMKGRLLGPLFARLPVPAAAGPDPGVRPAEAAGAPAADAAGQDGQPGDG